MTENIDIDLKKIEDELFDFFEDEKIIKTLKCEKDGLYSIVFDNEKIFFKQEKNFKQTTNPSTIITKTLNAVSYSAEGTVYKVIIAKEKNNKNVNSIFKKKKVDLDDIINEESFIINCNGTSFLVNSDEGVICNNKEDLFNLKGIIEEDFIKNKSLLEGEYMIVNSEILELYDILLKQINGINISKYSIEKFNNNQEFKNFLEINNELLELGNGYRDFSIDQIYLVSEIPERYSKDRITLSEVKDMLEFKKYDKSDDENMKKNVERFLKLKKMKIIENATVSDAIKKLQQKNSPKLATFLDNMSNTFFNFEITRDGKNNEIQHAANIVFSDDGKKYLIDSSLAAYEYLFVKDLVLNDEKDREYNVELFDTQKIVPGCDLADIYSVQKGGSCKLWSVFLNVETNKMVRDNPGRDPIEVINNNFDEIFLNASLGMSELIDKKKAVLFEKPVGTDKSLYKPCNFNDKTIYVLSTDDSDLKSKCVKTDVLINMIHKHEVERIINEEIIKDNKVIDHDKFQQLSSLLDTMEKDGLNAYVKSVKERKPELGKMLDSTEVMRKESRLYKDKTKKLKEEFNRLMSQRPKFVSSGRKLVGKEKKLEEEKHKKIKTQLNKKRKEINKVKNYSNYWQQKVSEQKKTNK